MIALHQYLPNLTEETYGSEVESRLKVLRTVCHGSLSTRLLVSCVIKRWLGNPTGIEVVP